MRNTVVNVIDTIPITIASGQSLSGALNLGGLRLFGIVMPSVWTTANITFQMSPDNGVTWQNVYDSSGNEVTVTTGTSRYIAMDATVLASIQWLQVRSGTNGTPVNQAQNSALTLILRSI